MALLVGPPDRGYEVDELPRELSLDVVSKKVHQEFIRNSSPCVSIAPGAEVVTPFPTHKDVSFGSSSVS